MIETKTILDKKALDALSRHGLKNLVMLMCILSGTIVIIGVSLLVMKLDTAVSTTIIVAGVIVPTLMGLLLFRYFVKINASASKNEVEQFFVFDDKVTLSEKSQASNADKIEYEWKAFYKAVETNEYFFLYLNKFMAFVIDKNGFTNGSSKDLNDMLVNRLGKKFILPKI